MIYRNYVCDALRIISRNTASLGDSYMSVSLSEMMNPVPKKEENGDQIAADIIKRIYGRSVNGSI